MVIFYMLKLFAQRMGGPERLVPSKTLALLRSDQCYRTPITTDKRKKSKISPSCLRQLLLSTKRYLKYDTGAQAHFYYLDF